jgi:RNA polymerase sigma-70 factor, ECF subfamily
MATPVTTKLLQRAMEGDQRAFQSVVESHQAFVFRVAYRLLRNSADAEDITQEAFIRLWKSMPKYRIDTNLRTWLYKIVTNLCLDFWKSARYIQGGLNEDLQSADQIHTDLTPEAGIDAKEFDDQLAKVLKDLAPLQKAVFVLRDLEALTTEETGIALAMSVNHVKDNLFHARKNISRKLKMLYETDKNRKL